MPKNEIKKIKNNTGADQTSLEGKSLGYFFLHPYILCNTRIILLIIFYDSGIRVP